MNGQHKETLVTSLENTYWLTGVDGEIGGFEQIANEEGKTFGDDAEFFEDVAHAHNILKFNGYLTEAQADAICQKLQAQLDSSIKPLKEEKRA